MVLPLGREKRGEIFFLRSKRQSIAPSAKSEEVASGAPFSPTECADANMRARTGTRERIPRGGRLVRSVPGATDQEVHSPDRSVRTESAATGSGSALGRSECQNRERSDRIRKYA